jgi:hypothetical protein
MISRDNVSLWSILKHCIGKELSKIAMPIVFNEPLSFLQRVTEHGDYLDLLEAANQSEDPIERMELVAAFAVGGLSNNADRMNKPFNPLLGETYELIQPEKGYKIVCEQVSHHPPVSAYHGESESIILRGSVQPKLKFWGKSIEVKPDGWVNVELKKHKEIYTWRNVNCCVHNIIVGKLWFEQYGVMEIINHSCNVKAVINFKSAGWFGRDLNRVDGFIFEGDKKVKFLYGKWTDYLKSSSMEDYNVHVKDQNGFKVPDKPMEQTNSNTPSRVFSKMNSLTKQLTGTSFCEESDPVPEPDGLNAGDIPKSDSSQSLDIPNSKLLWTVVPRPDYAQHYYNMTLMALSLNQLDPALKDSLPPTDCRLRPDIRILEEGDVGKLLQIDENNS